MVTNQTELCNLERLLNSDEFDMSLAIIADSGSEQPVKTDISLPDKNTLSFTGFGSMNFTTYIEGHDKDQRCENGQEKG